MFKRFGVAMFFGLITTTGLFYIMQGLIANDQAAFDETKRPMKLIYLSDIEEVLIDVPPPKVEPPPKPEIPPVDVRNLPELTGGDPIFEDPTPVIVDDPDFELAGLVDGTYLPIVKVTPQYPRRALARGIEGYVLLEFTVTKTGAVENPVVVESEPSGVFDAAAIKAALRFKYKPKVVDGCAVSVGGINNLISFSISGEA